MRTNKPNRCFWAANTVSMAGRILERVAWPSPARRSEGGLCFGENAPLTRSRCFPRAPRWPSSDRPCPPRHGSPYCSCRAHPAGARHHAQLPRHGKAPNEAVGAIDRDMIFVTEYRNGDLDFGLLAVICRARLGTLQPPACVAILLRALLRFVFPLLGDAAFLDRPLFVLGVVLSQRRDDGRIDDLPHMAR